MGSRMISSNQKQISKRKFATDSLLSSLHSGRSLIQSRLTCHRPLYVSRIVYNYPHLLLHLSTRPHIIQYYNIGVVQSE